MQNVTAKNNITINWNGLNPLPSPTWRWMGVNGAQAELTIPPVSRYRGKPYAGGKKDGVQVYDVLDDEIVFMDDEKDPTLHGAVLRFTRQHHNAGFFVHKAPHSRLAEPLVFDYRLDAQNPSLIDDNLVIAEEGSEVTVVMHYASVPDATGFHSGMTKLIAKKNATVRLIQVQTLGDACEHFDNVGALALEGGRVEVIQAELGGRRSFSGCVAQLKGVRSALEYDTVYLGDHERKLDLGVLAEQFGRKTSSVIEARGALLDRSEKIFRGTIDFKKGSSGSRGREQENTMLLSPHVRNRTAPLILCAEENVDGRHAASSGHVDGGRMYYLMSRGLSETEAKKLIIEAEFAPIVQKIPVAALRQEISDFLRERLNSHEGL